MRIILEIALGLIILSSLSGCVPIITGIKEYRSSDGTVISFITGGDFHVGANGTDTVQNRRGIAPSNNPLNAKY